MTSEDERNIIFSDICQQNSNTWKEGNVSPSSSIPGKRGTAWSREKAFLRLQLRLRSSGD